MLFKRVGQANTDEKLSDIIMTALLYFNLEFSLFKILLFFIKIIKWYPIFYFIRLHDVRHQDLFSRNLTFFAHLLMLSAMPVVLS